jgi:hypothetical protein
MIDEHDMTKKMLKLIREALDNNQTSVEQPLTDQPSTEQAPAEQQEKGPLGNVALTGVLPSGIQFTINYDENLGVTITNPEQTKLDKEVIIDENQLLGLREQFINQWNERGAKTWGKEQRIIYNDGNFGSHMDDKSYFETDTALFEPISNTNLKWLSYIINP